MKKILVISYYFLPQKSVGVFRTTRFLRHFKENDMEAEILSVKYPDSVFHPSSDEYLDEYEGFPVHYVGEMPTKFLWQGATIIRKLFARYSFQPFDERKYARKWWFVDMEYGWILPALLKGRKISKEYKPDAIYVSCPPFSASVIGYMLKKLTGVPLILDFRDGWIYSSYRDPLDYKNVKLVKRILANTDHLIVTSPSDANNYAEHLPVSLIYNGYDTEMMVDYKKEDDVFTLMHLGSWGTFNSSPKELLQALKSCEFTWKLVSIGNANAYLKSFADEVGVSEHVEYIGAQPKSTLPDQINKATLLLIVKGDTSNGEDSHIAAKVYDSLLVGKPTLAFVPKGDTAEMLRKYSNNSYICDTENLLPTLEKLYELWGRNELNIDQNDEFIKHFSGEVLTKKLAAIIHKLTS